MVEIKKLPILFRRIVIVRYHVAEKRIITEKAVNLIGNTASFVFESVGSEEFAILFLEVSERLEIILDFLSLFCRNWRLFIIFILSSY